RYSLVAAISVDGYVIQKVVEDSVDGDMFMEFIIDDLPRMNPWPAEQSVLIMDNCAIHKADELRE
ncbi:hypothetical protein DFH11DRAFT_1466612, partial [Phellopilus nigrolimitatus]